MTLVDTDVLIWYLRGNDPARQTLDGLSGFALSVVSYIELVQGMRSRRELKLLQRALPEWGAEVLPITEAISTRAVFLVERYFHSHALRLADALIAATALEQSAPLLTANAKHYRFVSGLRVEPFAP